MTMTAYNNDPTMKAAILVDLAKHREADELVKGQYWRYGKGCAVGCTLEAFRVFSKRETIEHNKHSIYDEIFGDGGKMLGRLEDIIFERLPNAMAQLWPERFAGAITPGADLSRVSWQFLHRILTDESINPGINHSSVKDAVAGVAAIIARRGRGETVAEAEATAAALAAEAMAESWQPWASRGARVAAAMAAAAALAAPTDALSVRVAASVEAVEAVAEVWTIQLKASIWAKMSDVLEELLRAA